MSGGDFLLERATHTTRMPTHTTMMVADTGTMMFRSIHSGSPGKLPALVSALFTFPPNGGASVPAMWRHTFRDGVVLAPDDADDDDGDEDDRQGGDHRDDQVDIGDEGHQLGLQVEAGAGAGHTVVIDPSRRGQGACKQVLMASVGHALTREHWVNTLTKNRVENS